MVIDPRFIKNVGREVFTGNELLVKGALESEGGVHLMTGYPGSPIASFFDTLGTLTPLLDEHGMVAHMANNEALAVAMVNGAQMAKCRSICAFKSVGMHVASDALALGVLAGTQDDGGGLIICGDDPWSDSTQVPADSRYLAEHVRMPSIEPSSPQEVKDWVNLGFKLGQAGKIYIGYIITTNLADGGGSVDCSPNHFPQLNERQKISLSYDRDIEPNLENSLLLPPRTWRREIGMDERFAAVKTEARRLGINRILHQPAKDEVVPIGFVAAGSSYAYLTHALHELGLTGRIPILKLGLVYPVDEEIVTEFSKQCEQVVVIEERRGFVERQIVEILSPLLQSGELNTKVYGKAFPKPLPGIPSTRGLNPSLLIERLVPLLQQHSRLPHELTNGQLTTELAHLRETADFDVNIPNRTPTFCPGCPHRDSSSVLLELRKDLLDPEYMERMHRREPLDLISHGDTGCYTMLMFEPTKPLMHNYSGMGLGGGTGSGIDRFIDNKQLVFMGDGTFFHSGQIAISHSIGASQDITYIILENKTTAMTGHQGHAGLESDLMGRPVFGQDIERIVQAMVPKEIAKDVTIVRTDPADRTRYRKLLEQTILQDGVKIVIADKECAITHQRRIKAGERNEYKENGFVERKTHMNVSTEVCEFCLECTNQTGCPGLKIVDTDYGSKIQTDMSWCVNDGACQRIDACPSFEEVTVIRKKAPRMGDEHVNLEDLPTPTTPVHAHQDTWRCYLSGIGGMGIGVATAILVSAGHDMGYEVQFLDKKGLAIRNGGVFSQLVYSRVKDDSVVRSTPEQSDSATSHEQDEIHERNHGAASQQPTTPASISPQGGITPLITYGKADLLLGIDLLEATRAIDPVHPYRVSSPRRTAAVVNTAKTPTILTLMGDDDFKASDLEKTIKTYARDGHYFGFNVGDLCERVLDSKLYANIMMLGIAFQNGYLPLTQEVIEKAIRSVVRRDVDRNLRAFNIGRKIAVRPDLFVVEARHDYEPARKAFRRKVNTLRAWQGGGKRGKRIAKQFRVLIKKTQRRVRGLRIPDSLMREFLVRAYDCLVWGGVSYAEHYCDQVVAAFMRDDAKYDYRLTRTVVWNLAKAMCIKDEVYCASLYTNPEKYKADRRRFNVNPANGDRIVYKHHNRPEFELFGKRIRFEWKSRDWQLRLMSKMRFLRKLLPGWHKKEVEFRDWYETLITKLDWSPQSGSLAYEQWVAIFNVVESVKGFREVRYPKMQIAQQRAEELLAQPAEKYNPASMQSAKPNENADAVMQLPVVRITSPSQLADKQRV
jgi:indolepyruvate ferredoxin oxidoreductase